MNLEPLSKIRWSQISVLFIYGNQNIFVFRFIGLYANNDDNIAVVATMVVVMTVVTIYWLRAFSQLQVHQTALSVNLC